MLHSIEERGIVKFSVAEALGLLVLAVFHGGCSSSPDTRDSDPSAQNPYTARFACGSDTGYDGDEQCVRAPDEAEGFQLHYGPESYEGNAVTPFLLAPGSEITDCLFMTTPNDRELYWQEYHLRARPGTHHVILWAGNPPNAPPDGTLRDCTFEAGMGFMVGAQAGLDPGGLALDVPLPDQPQPPENENLGFRIRPATRIAFQVHYVNATNEPILRESWVNFHYKPAEAVAIVVDPIFFIAGFEMNVPPNTRTLISSKGCTLPQHGPDEVRLLGVSGHMHAHGQRFSAFKIGLNGERTLFYETFNWQEPLNAQFDSTHEYPGPDTSARKDGALSGVLTVKRGEVVTWECDIDNTSARSLEFGNGAYTAEMCNLFGYYAPTIGGPWNCVSP